MAKKQEFKIQRIISGGQTGVDRAALDAALESNFPCGGWCPKGRKAEDGPLPARYPVKETKSSDYRVRTELNVKEADGTLILTWGKPAGGTALTIKLVEKHKKPYLVLDLKQKNQRMVTIIYDWIEKKHIRILNVAGTRESEAPGIYDIARHVISSLIGHIGMTEENKSYLLYGERSINSLQLFLLFVCLFIKSIF